MTTLEKVEIMLIAISGVIIFAVAPMLPEKTTLGNFLLSMSALLLLQGLIRDVFLLLNRKRASSPANSKTMQCLCLESTIGIAGIVIGAGILGFGLDAVITMEKWYWVGATLLTFSLGFLIKDSVLQSNPWRIITDKDHINIIASWKKPPPA